LIIPKISDAGNESSGGGDASEAHVNQIRGDIWNWIESNGARDINLPWTMSYDQYTSGMLQYLSPGAVLVGFISTAEEAATQDPDLKVSINGQPKTCVSSIWQKDGLPHIECNTERFAATSDADQYPLIHHEFAGLAGLEKNVGAQSDYEISSQLTAFLTTVTVTKLAIDPSPVTPQLTDVVLNSDGSVRLFVQSSDYLSRTGHPLPNGQLGALEYCASIGNHLPSAKEFIQFAKSNGAIGLEPPDDSIHIGYMYFTTDEVNGIRDQFNYTNAGFIPTSDFNSYWSSSVYHGNLDHVYTYKGQDGSMSAENGLRITGNAVRCAIGK